AAEPPEDAPEPARPELWPAIAETVGDGVVPLLLGGHEHLGWASPLDLADAGVPVLAVHGTADEVVPAEWSRRYAEKSGERRYVEVDGGTHFDVTRPQHPVWPSVAEWIDVRTGRAGAR
ncbi:alpha/beta hydrolase, partial [Amycolatopsis sp. SID8362]|uniref:alpha/beta hydrolase n=1 Tax=Amycolatopsis sp. SID8362 TaxID=2690346 RepID=UPI00137067B9